MAESSDIKLRAREYLIKTGEIDNNLYWLKGGSMQVIIPKKDGDKVVGQITEGELVGEMSFMDGKPRSASVMALTPCTLMKIPASQFEEILAKQPKWFQVLVMTVIERLRNTNQMVR